MVKFTGTSCGKPQGFGFDSRKNRERGFLPEFFIREGVHGSHRRSRRQATGVLGRTAKGKQPRKNGKNLKSLRRGEGAGYFDKPITTRLRVRVPPTTQVVVAQWTERWIGPGAANSRRKKLCCREGRSLFGNRERAFLRSALKTSGRLFPAQDFRCGESASFISRALRGSERSGCDSRASLATLATLGLVVPTGEMPGWRREELLRSVTRHGAHGPVGGSRRGAWLSGERSERLGRPEAAFFIAEDGIALRQEAGRTSWTWCRSGLLRLCSGRMWVRIPPGPHSGPVAQWIERLMFPGRWFPSSSFDDKASLSTQR
jgi:hypothetical protein